MTAPRSLADDLRRRDDAALSRLLQLRPDLLHPVPADFTALTSRATAAPSVSRCLDSLDALHLFVLSVIAEQTKDAPAPREALVEQSAAALAPDAHDACDEAMTGLVDRALVWGDADGLRAIASVADLVSGSPVPPWPAPGSASIQARPVDQVDREAGLHAREALSLVRDLLDEWSEQPPGVLRTGGLSLKDFAAARAHLHCDYPRAALTIDLAQAARLVADDEEEQPHWVPTDRFDTWVDATPAEAWLDLVDAWLRLPRLPSRATAKTKVLVGTDDRRAVPVLRREALHVLADLPEGAGLREAELIAVLDHQRPRRAGDLRQQVVAATLREGSDLGILSGGALSTAGRRALEQHAHDSASRSMTSGSASTDALSRRERIQAVHEALTSSMPDEVDHLLIGADLTLVAPGPLAPAIARRVGSMADIESRGHATVYRINESSVRRALDAGWDAEGVLTFLTELSRTPVPQPLAYLVEDVARRHGAVRVGPALSYLRSDAPQTLAAMVEDRRLRTLGLRRIADTVLICSAPTPEVLAALREAGYAPAAEGPDGGIVIRRPEDHRVRAPRAAAHVSSRAPEPALISAAVKTIRAGDRASGPRGTVTAGPAGSTAVPSLPSSAVVSHLREAIADTTALWIGYADTDGTVVDQIVDPIRLAGGVLTAFDHRTDGVRTFAVSRITGVAAIP